MRRHQNRHVAQTLSPYQPTDRPLGLPLAGPTYLDGSDAASQLFDNYKQSFLTTITTNLPEGVAFRDNLNPSTDTFQAILQAGIEAFD